MNNEKGPILVVDIGNSSIVCAVFEDNELLARYRMPSTIHAGTQEYFSRIGQIMPEYPLALFKYIALGSVVPYLTSVWDDMLSRHSNAMIYPINGLSPIGLRYLNKDRSTVGADLVANAFAAWKKYRSSTLIVDLGTATTIQLVTADALYAGVAIAPGMKTAASQLFSKAAQLNEINLVAPKNIVGYDTEEAMRSGIVLGHALMIRAFIDEIRHNYPQYAPYKVILTGGLASSIAALCPADYILDSDLTLWGFYWALISLISESA
ncbi:MAG: type III pantothenate kinase [Candidatus Cloacimonetes bacterium]|nr:type III pantothenate kinase [Candidatus Cloacimonadota bacterium]MDD4147423.1 type III pantothenate kinase [Candidatus Cloacimonadota bacterium]MDD4559833.1 type III pantothenate kinase [Candidatus Cloacimonadota bacterium]